MKAREVIRKAACDQFDCGMSLLNKIEGRSCQCDSVADYSLSALSAISLLLPPEPSDENR